jgi:hypothetical protein
MFQFNEWYVGNQFVQLWEREVRAPLFILVKAADEGSGVSVVAYGQVKTFDHPEGFNFAKRFQTKAAARAYFDKIVSLYPGGCATAEKIRRSWGGRKD